MDKRKDLGLGPFLMQSRADGLIYICESLVVAEIDRYCCKKLHSVRTPSLVLRCCCTAFPRVGYIA